MTMMMMANMDGVSRHGAVRACAGNAGHAPRAPIVLPPHEIEVAITRIMPSASRRLSLNSGESSVLMLAQAGGGVVATFDDECEVTGRRGVMLGRRDAEVSLAEGAALLIIRFPRTLAQIWASALHGDARRLAHGLLSIDLGVASALRRSLASLEGRAADTMEGADIVHAVLAALKAQHGADTAFPRARAASLARACLDSGADHGNALEDLAVKAGVTPITLQRGFKACLGMTVGSYAQAVRLHDARARLMSGWERRSIAEIAHGVGFRSVNSFTRGYHKLFGETPTQTRMVASYMNNKSHNIIS